MVLKGVLCFLLIAVDTVKADTNYQHYQMIGGTPLIAPHLFPFIVQIHTFSNGSLFDPYHGKTCLGSLISNEYILTAAHCFFYQDDQGLVRKVERIDYTMGAHNMFAYNEKNQVHGSVTMEKVLLHPDFNAINSKEAWLQDFALIQLAVPVSNSVNRSYIDFAKLPGSQCTEDVDFKNISAAVDGCTETAVVGWQSNASPAGKPLPVLVGLPTAVRPFAALCGRGFSHDKICNGALRREQACFGGSGGPLICRPKGFPYAYVIGVDSYTHSECLLEGPPEKHAVFGRICSVQEWVSSQIQQAKKNRSVASNSDSSKSAQRNLGPTDTSNRQVIASHAANMLKIKKITTLVLIVVNWQMLSWFS